MIVGKGLEVLNHMLLIRAGIDAFENISSLFSGNESPYHLRAILVFSRLEADNLLYISNIADWIDSCVFCNMS